MSRGRTVLTLLSALLGAILLPSACMKKPIADPGPLEWDPVPLPIPAGYDNVTVKTIRGTGAKDIWVLTSAHRSGDGGMRYGLAFHYDGVAWTPSDLPGRPTRSLIAIAPDDVWAVGAYGTVAHWDGHSWTTSKIDGIDYDLLEVVGWHDDLWIAVADSNLVHFDGSRWYSITPPALGGASVSSLFALTTGELLVPRNLEGQTPSLGRLAKGAWRVEPVGPGGIVHLAGSGPRDLWAVGAFNHSYHFDGFAWTRFPTSDSRVLGVFATSSTEAYLVGESGLVLAWNGSSWTRSSAGTSTRMWAVYAPPGAKPLIGGEAGLFRHR